MELQIEQGKRTPEAASNDIARFGLMTLLRNATAGITIKVINRHNNEQIDNDNNINNNFNITNVEDNLKNEEKRKSKEIKNEKSKEKEKEKNVGNINQSENIKDINEIYNGILKQHNFIRKKCHQEKLELNNKITILAQKFADNYDSSEESNFIIDKK